MAEDRQQEVRLQFLDEAQEHLDHIESGLLGLASQTVPTERLDAVLRAAHSIKGGAAMMGFATLSDLAHRLEDFFKVLKVRHSEVADGELERWLLASVDCLRQVAKLNRSGEDPDSSWLAEEVNPLFGQLHERLGDPQPSDSAAMISSEEGENLSALLFETEVEGCLQRLEEVLDAPGQPCLREEFLLAAQELEALGEMLELNAFSRLCHDVVERLEAGSESQAEEITRLALAQWRRSQALVLTGQVETLPDQLSAPTTPSASELAAVSTELDSPELATFTPDPETEQDAEEFFSLLAPLSDPSIEATPTPEAEAAPPASAPLTAPAAAAPEEAAMAQQNVRVPARQLAQLSDLFGELTLERTGLNLNLKRLRDLVALLAQRVQSLEQSNFRLRIAYDQVATGRVMAGANAPAADNGQETTPIWTRQFDWLELDRYSTVHLLSQEVMETVVQIQEVTSDLELGLEDTEQTARELGRTSKFMQASLTQLQMRPISDLLNRFPRALRNMALEYGKAVELKIEGGSTLVDRAVLEVLNEPLLHLLRNAFDHGIEDPATRRDRGKPEQGTIEIRAAYQGNRTAITVRDDGRGIDLDKIRVRAQALGLGATDLEQASDRDLLELIFEPGFSTAEQVTGLSGRGVGMDVVRTNLQQIRGEIQVETEPGVGTTFTITVPLTLAIARALLVESNGMQLTFPTDTVEEVLTFAPHQLVEEQGKEMLYWDDRRMPVVRLSQWLQFPPGYLPQATETTAAVNRPVVLVVNQGESQTGILVDRYWGEQEITVRQVEGDLSLPPGFSGCTISGEGRVVPLVDAIALLRWIDTEQTSSPQPLSLTPRLAKVTPQKDTVMVVDDSINVRRFLAIALEKAGYHVEQAKDGQDALTKLQAGLNVQAVVCDIEMPRLDGYGFLAQAKADPNYQHIPVVMLTSRSGDKHRRLAMNLGADGYFSKPFQEQELLASLEQLIQASNSAEESSRFRASSTS